MILITKKALCHCFFCRSSSNSTLSSSSQSIQVQTAVANNTLDSMILTISILNPMMKWSMKKWFKATFLSDHV